LNFELHIKEMFEKSHTTQTQQSEIFNQCLVSSLLSLTVPDVGLNWWFLKYFNTCIGVMQCHHSQYVLGSDKSFHE